MKTITAKILTLLILVIISVGIIITSVSHWRNKSILEETHQTEKSALVNQMKIILKEPVFVYDVAVIKSIIDSFSDNPIIVSMKVVDQREKAMAQFATQQKSDSNIVVKLQWNGKPTGQVTIGISEQKITDALAKSFQQSLISTLMFLLLLSIALIAILRKMVMQPLAEVNQVLANIAGGGGDLTARIPVKHNDEIGQLANSFNSFIQTVQNIIKDMSQASNKLEDVSEQVRIIKDKTLSNTKNQSELTAGSMTNMEHLDIATNEIAKSTESTVVKANHAYQLAVESRKSIDANIHSIDLLVENLEHTAEEVSSLKKASDNIGSVLDVIKGIAEQTNLLALNAAIEAARAGESGRGFAVVADEVRALASKTHESTSEIEIIIEKLQHQADTSFKATQTSKGMVAETITNANELGVALEQITDEMNGINDMVAMIASACEEQSNVTKVVSNDMSELSHGSQALNEDGSQLEISTGNLIEVGEQMVSQIHRFKY